MLLDPDTCYRALRTRDPRFDGRFFTAVRSTGVYCRPVCPARTPKRENCLFLPCAAAAQEAGYRPCLRCRPEASPGTPAWLGTSATVSRGLRLIGGGALDEGGVEDLAGRLGIGARHLRRLFLSHLGATPQAVAHTRRVLFAKKLIDETDLPMAQVAFAAGFSSVRRFNTALRDAYHRPPRELRRRGSAAARSSAVDLSLRLPYRPPLAFPAFLAFFAPRATPGVEAVDAECYRRTLALGGARGWVEVRALPEANQLVARLRLDAPAPLIGVTERLRRIFDLGADPAEIARHLRRDRRLASRLERLPGVRVPGTWDGFELAVRAILGQQVSVPGATTLAGRLVEAYGEALPDTGDAGLRWLFPTPEALAEADPVRLGIPRTRASAIAALSRAVAKGELCLDGSEDLDASLARLQALPGIGPWTAQLIAMRALGEPDALPAGDLGLRRNLGRSGKLASPAEVEARAEAWRPWRAYGAMLLWGDAR